ncbi:hypothetical protein HN51_046288 [Arachis hypogaea]
MYFIILKGANIAVDLITIGLQYSSCQADGQSALKKIKLYSNMATEMVRSWFSGRIRNKYWKWETIASLVAGFSTSLISITFFRFLQLLLSKTYRCFRSWILCFLLAYLSFVAWLAVEYGKRLGLMDIFSIHR